MGVDIRFEPSTADVEGASRYRTPLGEEIASSRRRDRPRAATTDE